MYLLVPTVGEMGILPGKIFIQFKEKLELEFQLFE